MFDSHVCENSLRESVTKFCSSIRNGISGQLNLVNILYSFLAIVVAFLSGNGISSGHLVKKSQNVKRYLYPCNSTIWVRSIST